MALKDRIQNDRAKVFINANHFATTHTWNGIPFSCVVDDDEALKRKNNNVNDISWDNNTRNILIHTPLDDFPGRREPEPNTHVVFDRKPMKVLSAETAIGMLHIQLVALDPREVV